MFILTQKLNITHVKMEFRETDYKLKQYPFIYCCKVSSIQALGI